MVVAAPGPGTAQAGRPRAQALVLAILVLAADQASKLWATATLSDGRTLSVVGDLIRFHLVYNAGAAFSIGTDITWVFAVVAAIAVLVLSRLAWRVRSRAWSIVLGLVLGGAATHLGDRLFRHPASPAATSSTSSTTRTFSSAMSPTSPWWSGWRWACC